MRKPIPKRFTCHICGKLDCVDIQICKQRKEVTAQCSYCGLLVKFLKPIFNASWEPVDWYCLWVDYLYKPDEFWERMKEKRGVVEFYASEISKKISDM